MGEQWGSPGSVDVGTGTEQEKLGAGPTTQMTTDTLAGASAAATKPCTECQQDPYNCSQGQALVQAIHERLGRQ